MTTEERKEYMRKYGKQYHLKNKKERNKYNKQYYLENKEKWKEYNKQLENKKERNKYNKQYRLKNKEKQKEYNKQYHLQNKGKGNVNKRILHFLQWAYQQREPFSSSLYKQYSNLHEDYCSHILCFLRNKNIIKMVKPQSGSLPALYILTNNNEEFITKDIKEEKEKMQNTTTIDYKLEYLRLSEILNKSLTEKGQSPIDISFPMELNINNYTNLSKYFIDMLYLLKITRHYLQKQGINLYGYIRDKHPCMPTSFTWGKIIPFAKKAGDNNINIDIVKKKNWTSKTFYQVPQKKNEKRSTISMSDELREKIKTNANLIGININDYLNKIIKNEENNNMNSNQTINNSNNNQEQETNEQLVEKMLQASRKASQQVLIDWIKETKEDLYKTTIKQIEDLKVENVLLKQEAIKVEQLQKDVMECFDNIFTGNSPIFKTSYSDYSIEDDPAAKFWRDIWTNNEFYPGFNYILKHNLKLETKFPYEQAFTNLAVAVSNITVSHEKYESENQALKEKIKQHDILQHQYGKLFKDYELTKQERDQSEKDNYILVEEQSELQLNITKLQEEKQELENLLNQLKNSTKDTINNELALKGIVKKLQEDLSKLEKENQNISSKYLSEFKHERENFSRQKDKLEDKILELQKIIKEQDADIQEASDKIMALAAIGKRRK